MALVVGKLAPELEDASHTAILNNLGGVTPLEMSILADALCRSAIAGQISHLIGPAPMMTALDMRGFSVSLLPTDQVDLAALATPVGPTAWKPVMPIVTPGIWALPENLTPASATPSAHPARHALLTAGCAALTAAEKSLNALDAKSGDGDTGSTLATAANTLSQGLDQLPLADLAQLYRALGNTLNQTMGGSSGVLLAIFFSAAGEAAAAGASAVAALTAGLERVQEVGGAKPGDRTMIDALAPALSALPAGLTAAAIAARSGADHTATITHAKAGRAAYVSERHLIGNNDPGAEAVALLFQAIAESEPPNTAV
jgi:dihydroxyacetone kinase